jgi:hypothetical protein
LKIRATRGRGCAGPGVHCDLCDDALLEQLEDYATKLFLKTIYWGAFKKNFPKPVANLGYYVIGVK